MKVGQVELDIKIRCSTPDTASLEAVSYDPEALPESLVRAF